ncbi:hypothetical protein SRB5_18010 [Streptomyces sp. RB5]|uniref:Tetratricopeptide repeat protein n=1 Tax=Streptomyces smaragdinus TaxID=2585196 RepID=A0A7K0CF64_9ACTN|nr:tetratricopeptide repeat protein [Streptomyces smaragdinus]MQY11682.1 hypothetical protein [Streptomyces smaragdinus]
MQADEQSDTGRRIQRTVAGDAAAGLRARFDAARRALATGDPRVAAGQYGVLLGEARARGLVREEAQALLGLGHCGLENGELEKARDHFEAAERLIAGDEPAQRARAVRGRAVAHLLSGELRYSCYLIEAELQRLAATGAADPTAVLILCTAAIPPYMDMGAHARAAQAAEQALALEPRVDDPAAVASMHRSVARTFLAEGRTAEADASLARATELFERLQIRTELAHCHWMRGYVLAQRGELESAEHELRTARDMLLAKRAVLFTAQVEVELADVLRRRGSTSEAAQLLQLLLDPARPGFGTVHAAGAHRLLGLIAEAAGDDDRAEEHYVNALALLETAGAAGDLADLCRLLGDLLRRAGRTEAALETYRTGLGHRASPGTTTLGPAPSARP